MWILEMDSNYLKNLQSLVGNAVNAVNITAPPSVSGVSPTQANSLSGFVTAGPSGSSGNSGNSDNSDNSSKGKLKFVLVSTHCHQYTDIARYPMASFASSPRFLGFPLLISRSRNSPISNFLLIIALILQA